MTPYNIIGSSSSGNAIIYHNEIMVDFGLPYSKLKPYLNDIKFLLLTHEHGDHFNLSGILKMSVDYPYIAIFGNEATIGILQGYGINNIFVMKPGILYELGEYEIASFELEHNVPNYGYRINKKTPIEYYADNELYLEENSYFKIFHATDTGTLDHVSAPGCDLYMVEHNYKEELLRRAIARKKAEGGYIYEARTLDDHLSVAEAREWLAINNTKNAEVVELHKSDKYRYE